MRHRHRRRGPRRGDTPRLRRRHARRSAPWTRRSTRRRVGRGRGSQRRAAAAATLGDGAVGGGGRGGFDRRRLGNRPVPVPVDRRVDPRSSVRGTRRRSWASSSRSRSLRSPPYRRCSGCSSSSTAANGRPSRRTERQTSAAAATDPGRESSTGGPPDPKGQRRVTSSAEAVSGSSIVTPTPSHSHIAVAELSAWARDRLTATCHAVSFGAGTRRPADITVVLLRSVPFGRAAGRTRLGMSELQQKPRQHRPDDDNHSAHEDRTSD